MVMKFEEPQDRVDRNPSNVISSHREETMMSVNGRINQRSGPTSAHRALIPVDSPEKAEYLVDSTDGHSRLRLQVIEPVAIVRFTASEILVGDTVALELIGQLEDLVKAKGHARLLLNFEGVRYLSSEMLAALAGFGEEMDRRGGRVQFCGLDPLMRDLLRITHLDRLFDICVDEAEALGLLIR
jgi:anti-sigma B factor antagonist